MASSKPSFPAPSEPNLKRLGVGGGGPERPLRAQLVVAVVVTLVLVAVPLYLLRRPSAQVEDADATARTVRPALIRNTVDAGPRELSNVTLGMVQRVTCSSSPGKPGNEGSLCDSLPVFEHALASAIKSTSECAPRTGKSGTINYVLSVNFSTKRLHVFPGASGSWKGPQAKAAAKCVKRALPKVDWDSVMHRYRYYMIAIMANYPAPDPLESLPAFE